MDMTGNDTDVEPAERGEDAINFHTPNMASDWHLDQNNTTNTSVGDITMHIPIWNQTINGQSLSYCDTNVQNNVGISSSVGPVRTMLRDSLLPPAVPRMLSHSLPPFPSDSGFIQRAAMFSCFSGGSLSEMVNHFSMGSMQSPHEVSMGSGSIPKLVSRTQSQKHGTNMIEVAKDSFKNENKREKFMRSRDEARNGIDVLSGNRSDIEAEFSGGGSQDELGGAAEEANGKRPSLKKRKSSEEITEHNASYEATQPSVNTAEIRQKDDQILNPSSSGGKNGKKEPEGSNPPKEEYIHVRARRGQATNSHSLAERIRREKISERMKYLQDIVPGCSKVTGKAVMLDEIINYVQSLQRQVEFLSMKLATVNPQVEFNMESFLAKDILQSGAGLSSSLPFTPDMAMPFHPINARQRGLIQAGLADMANNSEALQRSISLQSQNMQAPGVWEDELHNIVHNG